MSRVRDIGSYLVGPVALLGTWELVSRLELVQPVFFPPPTRILAASTMLFDVESGLGSDLLVTLVRLTTTALLSIFLGVSTGLAISTFIRAARGAEMVLSFFYPIPAILFLPLISFAAGRGQAAIIITALITPYIVISIYTIVGLREIDGVLLEAGASYGAFGWRRLLRVLIPGALPVIATGIRVALGYTLITVVATEMVGADTGLGARLWESWQILRVLDMYVALAAVAVMGLIASVGFDAIAKRLMPWQVTKGARP